LVGSVFSFTVNDDSVSDEENQIPDKNKNLHKFVPPELLIKSYLRIMSRGLRSGVVWIILMLRLARSRFFADEQTQPF
jgi:hypothetical protein